METLFKFPWYFIQSSYMWWHLTGEHVLEWFYSEQLLIYAYEYQFI